MFILNNKLINEKHHLAQQKILLGSTESCLHLINHRFKLHFLTVVFVFAVPQVDHINIIFDFSKDSTSFYEYTITISYIIEFFIFITYPNICH